MSDFDKIIDIYPDPYLTDKGKAYAEGFRHGESKALLFAVVSMLIASICISVYKLFM
ncbi:MAG: hypothetical protein PHX79_03640 [Sphaerochaetaceae bacterium]|nr:hypothetical protein [Sphaerochaetaceae bacterium]